MTRKYSRSNIEPRPHQQTSLELCDHLLDFIQRKFYPGHAVAFAKDRPRLLEWVVLWPAKWLKKREVTIPPDRYRAILESILFEALSFGNLGEIGYLPGYLGKVVQSHFEHHEDEIYDEAKSFRTQVQNTLLRVGKLAHVAPPDPVREMAAAARLLRPKKAPKNKPVNDQLNLL